MKINQIINYLMEEFWTENELRLKSVLPDWPRSKWVTMSHSVRIQRKFKTREYKVSIKRFSSPKITRQIAAFDWSQNVTWLKSVGYNLIWNLPWLHCIKWIQKMFLSKTKDCGDRRTCIREWDKGQRRTFSRLKLFWIQKWRLGKDIRTDWKGRMTS